MRDGGAAIGDLRSAIEFDARSATDAPLDTIGESLAHATLHASTTVDFLGASGTANPRPPFPGAVPFYTRWES